ncbi:MAG: hypothetical protein ACYC1C_14130 [Chloroflexota bacterium]
MPKDRTKKRPQANQPPRELSPEAQAFVRSAGEHVVDVTEPQTEVVATLADEAAQLPPPMLRLALSQLAHDGQDRAVPLLETVARKSPVPAAIVAMEVMGTLRHPAAAEALQNLVDSDLPKELRKEARRSLFRLQTAGVAIRRVAEAVRPAPTRQVVAAKITNVDSSGARLVALAIEAPLGAADLVTMLVNDETGIIDGMGNRVSLPELPQRLANLMKGVEGLHVVDAPADYCREVLLSAHELSRATGHPVPDEFYHWRPIVGEPSTHYEKELIYEEINPAFVRWNPQLLEQSGHLLQLPEFAGWLVSEDRAMEAADQIARLRETHLVLPGQRPEAQEMRTIDRLVESIFDAQTRLKYKRRLEQTAYVLQRLGHVLDARLAVAAALALDPAGHVPLNQQPFPTGMVTLTIEMIGEEEAVRRERTGGLLLPPR